MRWMNGELCLSAVDIYRCRFQLTSTVANLVRMVLYGSGRKQPDISLTLRPLAALVSYTF